MHALRRAAPHVESVHSEVAIGRHARAAPARVEDAALYAASRLKATVAVVSLVHVSVYSPARGSAHAHVVALCERETESWRLCCPDREAQHEGHPHDAYARRHAEGQAGWHAVPSSQQRRAPPTS